MDVFRKSLKAYIVSMILFVLLTAALAALVTFTGFKEEWTFAGLVISMTISSLILGYFEGRAIGRRGMIWGALAALIFVALIILSAGGVFSDMPEASGKTITYLIPIVGGSAGGIIGVAGRS